MIRPCAPPLSSTGRSTALPISSRIALYLLLLSGTGFLAAQAPHSGSDRFSHVDLAISYQSQRSLKAATGQNFWMQGGRVELGADVSHGWGAAAEVAGSHAGSIGTGGVPLSLLTATLGPRYRWHSGHRSSVYGEAMIGEANGFHSLFPAGAGSLTSSNSFALQAGGGADFQLSERFALRVSSAWLRTQFPNATDNVQNNLRAGAGIAIRLGRQ